MGQIEATSPYETFELFSRTPLPPDLAKTRRFQREPETTKFVRQPVDDTVPFSPFDGAELAILPSLPAATPPAGSRQVEARRPEDDSIEIVIVDSGEIERVAPLDELAESLTRVPLAKVIEAAASVEVELGSSVLEPLESAFLMPVAIAEPSPIAARAPTEVVRAPAWRLPVAIALFLAAAFACGIAVAFALG